VDFVWYIPACLSVTLALAVCTLRLAQLSLPAAAQTRTVFAFARPRWLECTAVATILGAWTTYTYLGPAVAAVHWDRYLRDAVAGADVLVDQTLLGGRNHTASEAAMRNPLTESMQHHLEQTVRWDPSFARAHLRLAGRYVQRFEHVQQEAENAMNLPQIRAAAEASTFASPAELEAWLRRAFGANVELLYRAHAHARQAASLSPLEGDAYVFLAELGFLTSETSPAAEACIAQAQSVRPYDGDVVFEVGKQALLKGDPETALREWAKCFAGSGVHQMRIVDLLAGRIPARAFLEILQPDWRTLREIWARYRQLGSPQDLNDLVVYAAQVTQRDVHSKNGIPPAYLWLWQSAMYNDLGQEEQSLACLEHAYECNQHVYSVRYELGCALKKAGRFVEAEPHLRWCLARRPENKGLSGALLEITKMRVAQREPEKLSTDAGTAAWRR
jgi:tetratricopeptide (TPR) repeat protein